MGDRLIPHDNRDQPSFQPCSYMPCLYTIYPGFLCDISLALHDLNINVSVCDDQMRPYDVSYIGSLGYNVRHTSIASVHLIMFCQNKDTPDPHRSKYLSVCICIFILLQSDCDLFLFILKCYDFQIIIQIIWEGILIISS